MIDELVQRIKMLPDEQVLEAVNSLGWEVVGAAPDDELCTSVAGETGITSNEAERAFASASGTDVAELGRLTLIVAALSDSVELVAEALDNVGERAMLLEIAVVALLASAVLQQILTRGRKSETREVKLTAEVDGRIAVSVHEDIQYFSVGAALAPLVGKLLSRGL